MEKMKEITIEELSAMPKESFVLIDIRDPAGETDGRNLRGAVNDCVWRELNRSVSAFAESITLSNIMQKCRELSGNWDMYVI